MVLNLFALAFTLGITIMQSVYGLFSGMIMAICSIVSAVVAFAFFEPLNDWASGFVHPSYSAPGCFVVLFLVTLIVLRVAFDNLIRGNVRVPAIADWAGGAVCGFISAMLCVGVLMLGLQMLPMGGTVMTYSGYELPEDPFKDDHDRPEFLRRDLWLKQDRFAAGLVSLLSSGSLAGGTPMSKVYPDFPQWVHWTSNTIQTDTFTAPAREKSDGFDAVSVSRWWEVKGPVDARYRTQPPRPGFEPVYEDRLFRPQPGMKLIGVELEMGEAAGDWHENRYVMHRFRPTMIRLVGDLGRTPKQYDAQVIGGADEKIGGALRISDMNSNYAVGGEGTTVVHAYFEVDQDFTPRFVEYRRFARAPVTGKPAEGGPFAPPTLVVGEGGSVTQQTGERTGRMGLIGEVDGSVSGDRTELPFPMQQTSLVGEGAEVRSGQLLSGRISGNVSTFRAAGPGSVREFAVPDGYRLCQVRWRPYKAQSLAGQVFNFVGQLNQFYAHDDKGQQHLMQGYYAIVNRGGEEFIELFYSGERDSPMARGMLDFQRVQQSEIQQEGAQLGMIFIVPPGVTIQRVVNQKNEGVTGLSLKMGG